MKGDLNILESLRKIGENAFYNDKGFNFLSFNSELIEIDDNAFCSTRLSKVKFIWTRNVK